ncbi:MAG: aspartate--tRNA ligase [Candidatus Dormibacteria bacterium]
MRGRTYCGTLEAGEQGREVVLAGWVSHRRDHGGLTFIDLRDHTGVAQLVFNPELAPQAQELASQARLEWVLRVEGTVQLRPAGSENPNLPTGAVEVMVSSCQVLAKAEAMPFNLGEEQHTEERVRLQYRYLDLRSPRMQAHLRARHRFTKALRDEADRLGFVEIETPTMVPSTPEGARDFLIPSRLWPGHVWALPQSPQLYKQLSMVAGFDRYFQIARCWRDEDGRADRQLEFTQLDLEMSFVDEEEVQTALEAIVGAAWEAAFGLRPSSPWPRLTYAEAQARYGSDKPDTRFGNELHDVSAIFAKTPFRVFAQALATGGAVRALRVPGGAELGRSELEGEWLELARTYGAGGLAYVYRRGGEYEGAIARHLGEGELVELTSALGVEDGDCVCFTAGPEPQAGAALGQVRLLAARRLGWIPPERFDFLWVTEFPMFELAADGQVSPMHHPFTQPHPDDWGLLASEPLRMRSRAYDIVCNGVELGSGSLRITDPDQQRAILQALGMSDEEAQRKFGFLLTAFRYGAPPHGGFAAGVDRMVMLGCGEATVREVIAFPKTQTGSDPMTGAPTPVAGEQLAEVGLGLAPGLDPSKPPS